MKENKIYKSTMTLIKINKEWERIRTGINENKPKIDGPYPPRVTIKRELLLHPTLAS